MQLIQCSVSYKGETFSCHSDIRKYNAKGLQDCIALSFTLPANDSALLNPLQMTLVVVQQPISEGKHKSSQVWAQFAMLILFYN